MKNLLSAITSGSLGSSIKAANVKEILAEVQSYRDTKAADVFYETLERVLNELRATPEAVAFRNPVKKSEAPDYEDYIKTPMDMSTMLKKVKNRVYENKAQFAADLNLIWDNCLTYNSEPTHPLRRQAQLMRRKADHVLERINDRGEVSKPSKNGKVKPKMSAKDRDRERQLEKERIKMREREKKLEQTTKNAAASGGLGQSLSVLLALDAKEAAQGEANAEQEAAAKAELENAKKDENGLVQLPRRTAESMARFLQIERQMDNEPNNGQSIAGPSTGPAIDGILTKTEYPIITPFGAMNVFQPANPTPEPPAERRRKRSLAEAFDTAQSEALAAVEKKREERQLQNGHAPKGKGVGIRDELLKDWFGELMKPDMVVAGVPELEDWVAGGAEMPVRKRTKLNGALVRRKKKKPVRKETLRSSIESNVQTLYEIRKNKDKLQKLADLQEAEERGEEDVVMEEPLPDLPEQPADPPRPGYYLNPEDAIKNSSYLLLRHAGFEGTSKTALGVINAVGAEYIRNIGRTMRYLLDVHSNDMPAEEIVLHTLFENGVTEVNQLERYVRDDVQRYGGRLQEISRRLQTAYREQAAKEVDDDDYDEEEDIVGGGLGDVLGVDFLGLGDLGLEGVTSFSVPKRLLLGKPSKKAAALAAAKAKPAEKVLPYPKPTPYIPLTEDKIDKQIGLLHNFYKSKLLPMPSVTENGTQNSANLQDSQTANNTLTAMVTSPGGGILPQPVIGETKPNTDIKRYVPEDPGNASRTKIGPKGEILLHAPVPSAKKKKGKSTTGSEAPVPPPLQPPPQPILPKVEDGRLSPAQTPVAIAPSAPASGTVSVTTSPTLEKRKGPSQSPVNAPRPPPQPAPPQPPPGMMPHPAYPSLPPFPGYPPPLAPGAPPLWAAMYGAPPWMQPMPNGAVPPPPLPPDAMPLSTGQPPKPPAYSPATRGGPARGRGGTSNGAARGGAARGGAASRARGGPPTRGTPAK
ncbi:hypothetical protein CALCODRAFT_447689 [Calocera cornea HHB12733]|uniref:Bromo domain-containing protein n=1 Tax=Calocera cornea HHB12733 TaxID=1353952 RepID=A0A165IYD2_9BASI|nr:hypothetical protein CALCODRAFT_447689 [Calocera cornea HHB12733]